LFLVFDDKWLTFKSFIGNVEYRVTEESLIERLNTDMSAAASSIDKECRLEYFPL